MRLEHPIFQGPLQPKIELVASDWGQEYDDRGVWVVQTGEPGKTVDYGVVSDGHGFEDSPDCERISGGVNSKGPYAVAIGRQANMLQWGFYAAPDRMTESAQQVFLNTLVYMQQFDGRQPMVEKLSMGRTWMLQMIDTIGTLEELPEEHRANFEAYLRQSFPKQWVDEVGLDPEQLLPLVQQNIEYLYCAPREYNHVLDTTLQALGVSNREPAFLALLTERLTKDPQDAVALELAARYLGDHGQDAASALAYLKGNEGRLYFSDSGGFRWLSGGVQKAAQKPARIGSK